MSTATLTTAREKTREKFLSDTANHRMRVMHDDGLYRHLRFNAPGSWTYGFDIVTWPGFLAVTGDVGEWTFSRTADMVAFFEDDRGDINPDYWSEKLRAGSGGESSKVARRFSSDRLRAVAMEWWNEQSRDLDGETTVRLRDELLDHIRSYDPITVESAIACLDCFEFDIEDAGYRMNSETLSIAEPYFYDFTDWNEHFLWVCWAIVYGLAHYRVGPMPSGVAWSRTQEPS